MDSELDTEIIAPMKLQEHSESQLLAPHTLIMFKLQQLIPT